MTDLFPESPHAQQDGLGRGPTPPPDDISSAPGELRADPAFERLFLDRFTPMVRLATLLGADDPEDLVQEAFFAVFGKWRKLRDTSTANAYLATAVVNRTRSRHRRLAVARRLAPPAPPHPEHPEDRVMLRAEHAEVMNALRRLPPRQREALVLRFFLDYSDKQMAEAMGASAGTVRSTVSRGLSALRGLMPEDFQTKGLQP